VLRRGSIVTDIVYAGMDGCVLYNGGFRPSSYISSLDTFIMYVDSMRL